MSNSILFSVPTENGEYQLFGPVYQNEITIDPAIYKLSEEELDKIKTKRILMKLTHYIETFFHKNKVDSYELTKYTICCIDEVEASIFIYLDYHDNPTTYYYKIISRNIDYEPDNGSIEKSLLLYESSTFITVYELLEHVKKVEITYKFLDYYLLSPEKMEEAIIIRRFLPINPDKVCSVCYEPTIEYTTCKHSICLKCRDKCIVQGKTTCPICRGSDLSVYPNSL
jgi:hypothetical protein